ncbi:hypothetical protein [Mesorhizobium sp. M00.F.Ca.ET.216.01.1.1]|uniref:hypothetical protein n=1 Tax=Mesorhizobium sp. M00.F.Ca.ET.216.01.1.1 TaxID=2500528 RepID=UPI000FDA1053|nr:hypothetical protein [Mesorhizobium sp. M00.F.Ca.ET.216.01.1.1]TGQ30862.1 hypothetical protein EN859_031090 [Mesorhizobium sp. M00.F.Ca.ET.216.01.1.1]
MSRGLLPDLPAARRPAALRPACGIIACRLDRDVVLFSEPQQRVYQFDATSGSVWFGVTAGETLGRIARRLAAETRCTLDEARDCVLNCLAEWQELGFLSRMPQEPAQPIPGRDQPASIPATGPVYQMAGIRIAIAFPDVASRQAWDAIAGHLRHDVTAEPTGVAEAGFAIEPFEGGYRMLGQAGDQPDFADPAAVAVGLKEAVLHAVLERRPDWIALHAAMLSCGSSAVLLAGSSGHGKTTLAAVLNASGMPAIADDVALVSVRPAAISGLPFAFAAKPGSLAVLRTWFPALDRLAEFQRPDGRKVKYIEPVRVCEQASSVCAVIFPRFSALAALQITQLRKVAGLTSLLEEAINASHWLTADGFVALCTLLDGAVVIQIDYGDASTAAEWIRMNLAPA